MKIRIVAVSILFVMMTSFCLAQASTATLSGAAVDESGAFVPGVQVNVLNPATGFLRTTVTNNEGYFTVPSLPPAKYIVQATHKDFNQTEIRDVILHVGDQMTLQIKLKVRGLTQSVTINEETTLISVSPAVSTVMNRQFVSNLPLNGRSFQSLILLTPGVTVTTTNGNNYGQFSVNGQRASSNYFTVDGVSANIGSSLSSGFAANGALAGSYPGLSVFGGTNNLVSVDALEEFKIQTSTTAAEFGRQPGGQVQLVTRSGANQFHGTMFEYFRNDALDANDWFNNANRLRKAALRQNDFGGTFSGPIVIPGLYDGHDRTFFFFSYEGQRLLLPTSGITYVPSLRVRSGAAAVLQPVLNAFPQPTGAELLTTAGVATGWAPYNYALSKPSTMDAYSIRIDHTVSSKLTLFGRFNQSPSNSEAYSGYAYSSVSKASTQTLTLGATSALTARLGNEFRVNYSRQLGEQQLVETTLNGAVPVDTAVLTNGLGGYGSVLLSFGGYSNLVDGGDVTKSYQRQINVVDNVSLVKGAHQFKFGVDYRRLSPTYGVQGIQSVMFFSAAAVTSATASSVSILHDDSARPRFDNYSLYAQDTWKVTPRLTLDYGLRWDLNPAPSVPNGEEMPAVVTGINGTDVSKATLAPTGTPFYKTFYRAFGPRGGVAYELNQTSGRETVLRGGFGVYYDLGSAGATSAYPFVRVEGAV